MRVTVPFNDPPSPFTTEQRAQLLADTIETIAELEVNAEIDYGIQSVLSALLWMIQNPAPPPT